MFEWQCHGIFFFLSNFQKRSRSLSHEELGPRVVSEARTMNGMRMDAELISRISSAIVRRSFHSSAFVFDVFCMTQSPIGKFFQWLFSLFTNQSCVKFQDLNDCFDNWRRGMFQNTLGACPQLQFRRQTISKPLHPHDLQNCMDRDVKFCKCVWTFLFRCFLSSMWIKQQWIADKVASSLSSRKRRFPGNKAPNYRDFAR